MTKAAFEKIVEGLREAVVVTAMAKSDAEFDGRPWESLGRKDRERCKIFNPLDAEFSLCADPNEQPEPEAPQFKPLFAFK